MKNAIKTQHGLSSFCTRSGKNSLTWLRKHAPTSRKLTHEEVNISLRWLNDQLSARNHVIEARLERLEKVVLQKWEREPTSTD